MGLILFGVVLSGVALYLAATYTKRQERRADSAALWRPCAYCLASIPRAAVVCRYCGRAQPEAVVAAAQMAERQDPSIVEGEVVLEPPITEETCTLDHVHGVWCRRRA